MISKAFPDWLYVQILLVGFLPGAPHLVLTMVLLSFAISLMQFLKIHWVRGA